MREKKNFCEDWFFHLGNIERKFPICKGPIYQRAKTERMLWGPAAKNYNEQADGYTTEREVCCEYWEQINLPHDYTIMRTPSKDNNVTLGFLPMDNGWYRKHFTLDNEYYGKHIYLSFEAVASNTVVYINGCLAGRHFGGASPFRFEITDYVLFGEDNVVAVFVENSENDGWWYGGGGIYRPAYLEIIEDISIDMFGVWVNPKKLSKNDWEVDIETSIRNDSVNETKIKIEHFISPKNRNFTYKIDEIQTINGLTVEKNRLKTVVSNPDLWDIDNPNLYTLKTVISIDGEIMDESETDFGFRTIRFDCESGFFLNEKPVKIKGVCCHQDYGLTGKAVPNRVQKYKLRLMKEMGANGYRTSHYPHSEYTMKCLDEMGFLVMDETRWFATDENSLNDLKTLVLRDRNHPSVILWSIGNEEPITLTDNGVRITRRLKNEVKKLDTSRPVIAAISNEPRDNLSLSELDIIGINYNIEHFEDVHTKFPRTPILASECCATGTTRGWYLDSCEKRGYFNAIDHDTNYWFLGREKTWKFLTQRKWIAGCFQWAGIEHRGEGGWWPRMNSASGAVDIYLQKKDAFYQNKSHWTSASMIHLLPHWNWNGFEGQEIRVVAYTNCDEAELFLNGNSLGRKQVEQYGHAEWQVPYTSGELKAIGYKNGKNEAVSVRKTTGRPTALKLRLDDEGVGKNDAAIITCYCVDENGIPVPDASSYVSFDSNEIGKVYATGADSTDHIPPEVTDRKLWQGLCSVLVTTANKTGILKVYAKSEGLKSAMLEIKVE